LIAVPAIVLIHRGGFDFITHFPPVDAGPPDHQRPLCSPHCGIELPPGLPSELVCEDDFRCGRTGGDRIGYRDFVTIAVGDGRSRPHCVEFSRTQIRWGAPGTIKAVARSVW